MVGNKNSMVAGILTKSTMVGARGLVADQICYQGERIFLSMIYFSGLRGGWQNYQGR
jgi:hypothetical protein